MPTLIMPTKSFINEDERTLSKIYNKNKKLIDVISGNAEVWVIGRKEEDSDFWQKVVFTKKINEVVDPFMSFPISDLSSISHFAVLDFNDIDEEYYFGNPSYNLDEFVRAVLCEAIVLLKSKQKNVERLNDVQAG